MPKISVIMPAYNAEKYIQEAIDSILCQNISDFELIVINDCSQDRTEQLILSYSDPRIVYVKNEKNLGVARTLNKGLELANGQYIARMDADDVSLPDRFEKQLIYMENNPGTVVCGSNILIFTDDGDEKLCRYPKNDRQIKTALLFACPFAHPSVMMRADMLRTHGLRYEEAFEKVEDYRLWSRLASLGDFANLPEPLLRYRSHSAQVCATSSQAQYEGKLRLAATILPQIGILDTVNQQLIVDVFDGRIFTEDAFLKFEMLAHKIAKNIPEGLDVVQITSMLKSRIIEIALAQKFSLNTRSLSIVGIKAWVYVNFRRIGGKKA